MKAAAEIQQTTFKVSDFITWQRHNALELSPSFQRRPVWSRGAKSLLVDTVVRGLPMPVIFLREVPSDLSSFESKREVVDGQQRIRTLISFVDSSLLRDSDPKRDEFVVQRNHNKEIAGTPFSDLDNDVQRRILDYQFSVHVFSADTDDREILLIFSRMNATGVRLNAQELRNAEYFGELKTLMYDLAAEQLQRWRDWKLFTENAIARMDEVELTSELAMMMARGISERTKAALDRFYEEGDQEFALAKSVKSRFRAVMDELEDNFDIAANSFKKRTMFYGLFVTVYRLMYGGDASLSRGTKRKGLTRDQVNSILAAEDKVARGKAPKAVLDATSLRTTQTRSRRLLIEYLSPKV